MRIPAITNNPQRDKIWPSLFSILAPLLQLIAAFSIGVASSLNVNQFFIYAEILNLVNFLVIFITLGAIGIYWHWRNNSLIFIRQINKYKNKDGSAKFNSPEDVVFDKIKKLFWASIFFFTAFILATMSIDSQFIFPSTFWVGLIQYISYSFVMIAVGFMIYVWLYEFVKKQQTFQREDFLKNLIRSLEEYGIVDPPNVKILKNQQATGEGRQFSKYLHIEAQGNTYHLFCSYDGLEITEIYTPEELAQLSSPQN